jgi:hypothetical protein
MKTFISVVALLTVSSCMREGASDKGEIRSAPEGAAVSTAVASLEIASAPVVGPTNAPTDPQATRISPQELAKSRRGEMGTVGEEKPEAARGKARSGRGVATCSFADGKKIECERDTDCKSGQACLCRPTGHYSQCVAAGCRTDADCPDGACIETLQRRADDLACATVQVALHCTSKGDECRPGPGACANLETKTCIFDPDGRHFVCADLCTQMPMMRRSASP